MQHRSSCIIPTAAGFKLPYSNTQIVQLFRISLIFCRQLFLCCQIRGTISNTVLPHCIDDVIRPVVQVGSCAFFNAIPVPTLCIILEIRRILSFLSFIILVNVIGIAFVCSGVGHPVDFVLTLLFQLRPLCWVCFLCDFRRIVPVRVKVPKCVRRWIDGRFTSGIVHSCFVESTVCVVCVLHGSLHGSIIHADLCRVHAGEGCSHICLSPCLSRNSRIVRL